MKMENLCQKWVRISKSKGLSPISISKLYHWSSTGQNPEIFSRIGGGVFVNLEAIDRLLESGIKPAQEMTTDKEIKSILARLHTLENKVISRRKGGQQ